LRQVPAGQVQQGRPALVRLALVPQQLAQVPLVVQARQAVCWPALALALVPPLVWFPQLPFWPLRQAEVAAARRPQAPTPKRLGSSATQAVREFRADSKGSALWHVWMSEITLIMHIMLKRVALIQIECETL
jgi:hypothetical protein